MNYRKNINMVYTYNLSLRLRIYIIVFILLMILVVTLASLFIDLTNPEKTVMSGGLPPPWGSLYGVFASVLLLMLFSNAYPNIQISNENLGVQVFLFWWVFVPWEDVLDIRNSLVGRRTQIAIVRHLTPIHRVFGLMYGLTLRPAFRISRHLEGYDEVMRYIREKIR